MALVRLLVDDMANRITLKAILEADGHRIVDTAPEVIVSDNNPAAIELARSTPTLVLAAASTVVEAVAAMEQGVSGYLFVPFQPGEASLMVSRATAQVAAADTSDTPHDCGKLPTLEEAEAAHIQHVLRRCKYNQTKAAKVLGIGRNTLWRKLRRIRENRARE